MITKYIDMGKLQERIQNLKENLTYDVLTAAKWVIFIAMIGALFFFGYLWKNAFMLKFSFIMGILVFATVVILMNALHPAKVEAEARLDEKDVKKAEKELKQHREDSHFGLNSDNILPKREDILPAFDVRPLDP